MSVSLLMLLLAQLPLLSPPPPPPAFDVAPPGDAPVARAPAEARQPAADPGVPILTGTHFFLGPTFDYGVNSTVSGFVGGGLAIGALFDRKQLMFELTGNYATGFMVQGAALFGVWLPMYESSRLAVSWILRGGVEAFFATSVSVFQRSAGFAGVRADLLGMSLRSKNVFFEFHLPTLTLYFVPYLALGGATRFTVGFTF